MTEINICPKCRKQNLDTTKICVFCGNRLNESPNFKSNSKILNLKSIILGFISILIIGIILLGISKYLSLSVYIVAIAPIIGGFIIAYANKPSFKIGILNSFIATLFIGILFLIFALISGEQFVNSQNTGDMYYNIGYIVGGLLVFILPPIILGIIGSVIGTIIKKVK